MAEKKKEEDALEEASVEEMEKAEKEAKEASAKSKKAKEAAEKAAAEESEKMKKLEAAAEKKAKEKRIEEMKEQFTELKREFDALGVDEQEEVLSAEPVREAFYTNANITVYSHHGALVNVRKDLKNRHREHSLCYSCQLFKPDTLNNCHIAQKVYDTCVEYHITTPVWECPEFKLKI